MWAGLWISWAVTAPSLGDVCGWRNFAYIIKVLSVDFELIRRETVLDGHELLRWALARWLLLERTSHSWPQRSELPCWERRGLYGQDRRAASRSQEQSLPDSLQENRTSVIQPQGNRSTINHYAGERVMHPQGDSNRGLHPDFSLVRSKFLAHACLDSQPLGIEREYVSVVLNHWVCDASWHSNRNLNYYDSYRQKLLLNKIRRTWAWTYISKRRRRFFK